MALSSLKDEERMAVNTAMYDNNTQVYNQTEK